MGRVPHCFPVTTDVIGRIGLLCPGEEGGRERKQATG